MLQTGPIIFRFRGLLGIPVEIGQTLLFLVLLLGGFSFAGGGNMVWLAVIIAMIILAIYLHELGHAWASLIQGVPVRRIVLHGGGGFCEHARSVGGRQQEFITAMGPLVNLALWALGSLAASWVWSSGLGAGMLAHYLSVFATLNFMYFVFNMLPVQPLDGGRLLQLALLRVVPQRKAMQITGTIGLVFAILWWPALFFIWFTTGWMLLFIPSIALHYRMMRGDGIGF